MLKPTVPIENLIADLHGTDWDKRCDAARLLGASRDPRAVDALLPDLNSADWRVRRNTAQALGVLRDKRAVAPLLQLLNDRVATVRQRVAVALGRVQDPQAIPALMRTFLNDKSSNVSHDAYQAIRKFRKHAIPSILQELGKTPNLQLVHLLVEIKHPDAIKFLLAMLESDDPSLQARVIPELGKLGDKQAIAPLTRLLDSNNVILASATVRALGQLGATETIPQILNLLSDYKLFSPRAPLYHAVSEAFQMFGGITKEIQDAFPGKFPMLTHSSGVPSSLPEALSNLSGSDFAKLNSMISNMREQSAKMASALGKSRESIENIAEDMSWKFGVLLADAKDAKQDRVKRLIELLSSSEPLARAGATLTLPWYNDKRAIEPLEQLTRDENEIVRRAATWSVNTLKTTLRYRGQLDASDSSE